MIGFSFDKVYIRIMRYLIISFLLIFNNFSYAENQSDQILCLAKNIYHEARGEEDDGKIAVSNVVINRVNSKNFPSDVCSVVYQRNQIIFIDMILKILPIPAFCQFSWTCDLKPNDSFNDSKSCLLGSYFTKYPAGFLKYLLSIFPLFRWGQPKPPPPLID